MDQIKYKLLKSFQILISILFLGVVYVLDTEFGGEFLIVYENSWMIWSLAIFLFVESILSAWGNRPFLKNKVDSTFYSKSGLMLFFTIWNFILAIILNIGGAYLIILIGDSFPIILLLVAGLPIFGYAYLFCLQSFQYLRAKRKIDLKYRGYIRGGIVFLLVISGFVLTIAFYNPKWTESVEHQALYEADYRIPSMIVLPDDTILTFVEKRADVMLDWGDIDIVMKKSIDSGSSWSEEQLVVDFGDHTAGNPTAVYDNLTDTLILVFCWDNKRVYTINSTDEGDTWSEPREITDSLNLDFEESPSILDAQYATGPGNGIQLTSGRLVIPAWYFDDRGSHVLYSDDHGNSWQKGENINMGNEPQIVQVENGSLYMNARTKGPYRMIAWSHDEGETWDPWYYDEQLDECGVLGSITSFEGQILYCHPEKGARGHITVRISEDEGNTWSRELEIFSGPSGYSNIKVLSDGTVCVFFEGGTYELREAIMFCTLNIDQIA